MNKTNLFNRGQSFIGIIIVIIVVLIIGGGLFFYLNSQQTNISETNPEAVKKELEQIQKISEKSTQEQGCLDSEGTVSTSSCCKSSNDFPNSCLVGACGCSPTDSHQVKICDCGTDKCFDGEKCVSRKATGDETVNCPVGTYANFGGSDQYEVKGIENHTIMGKSMDLCCGERTATSGAGKGKKCIDVISGDYNYLIMWVASAATGWQYDKLTEVYPKGGQRCMIQFENGNDIGTVCLPK